MLASHYKLILLKTLTSFSFLFLHYEYGFYSCLFHTWDSRRILQKKWALIFVWMDIFVDFESSTKIVIVFVLPCWFQNFMSTFSKLLSYCLKYRQKWVPTPRNRYVPFITIPIKLPHHRREGPRLPRNLNGVCRYTGLCLPFPWLLAPNLAVVDLFPSSLYSSAS